MIAGTLEIQMLSSMARLQADMTKGVGIVTSATGRIESAVASAKMVLGSLGIGLGVGYFTHLIKGSIDAMDHLHDLNLTTDIAVEKLAGLAIAAKQSGGDLDSIAASINKLSVNMGKHAEKFTALGVTAKDPLEAFKQLSDIFKSIQDQQLRSALGGAALGKAWAGAAPLLMEGSEKIGAMVEKGSKAAGITKEMADKADELNDKWMLLVGSGGALNSVVGKMLGPLLSLTNQMIAAKDGASGFIDTMSRFFSISGDEAKNAGVQLGVVNDKLKALRNTEEELLKMGTLKRLFSMDDIAIVQRQIAQQETKKSMLEGLLGAPFPEKGPAPGSSEAAAAAAANAARAAAFVAKFEKTEDNEAAYRSLLKALKEKLLYDGQLTAVMKLQLDLEGLSVKQRAPIIAQREKEMTALAREADVRKNLLEVSKLLNEQNLAAEKETERLNDITAGYRTSLRETVEAIQFETRMIGLEAQANGAVLLTREDEIRLLSKVSQQREVETALRQIGLDLDRQIVALGPEITEATERRTAELRTMADAQRKALPDAIAAREAAKLSNELTRNQFAEFNDLWRTVESTGKSVFVAVFAQGKGAFEGIGKAIKSSVIDLLYTLTAKKWIVQIGTSVAGSLGLSGTANAVGGGAAGFASSLFGAGIFGSAAAYGAAVPGLSMGGAQAAMLAAQTGEFGAAGLAMTAEAGGAAWAGGITAGLASIGPVGWAAIAAAAIIGGKALFGGGGDRVATPQLSGLDPASTIRRSGFSGQQWAAYGSSPTDTWGQTEWSGLENLAGVNAAIGVLFDTMETRAKKIGLDTSMLGAITATVNGTGQGVQKDLENALTRTSDTIALALIPGLADLQTKGETLTQTFDRITTAIVAAQDALDAQRRTMDIRLMEALGDAAGALAAKREDELKALDASLRPLQEQINAALDQATANEAAARAQEAAAAAAEAVAQAAAKAQAELAAQAAQAAAAALALAQERRGLEIRLMQAQGNAAGVLAATRADELAATNDLNRELLRQIYAAEDLAKAAAAATAAQEDQAKVQQEAARAMAQIEQEREAAVTSAADALRQAYQRESSDLVAMIGKWEAAGASLRAYSATLTGLGGGGASYGAASRAFDVTAASARLGDLTAIGDLQKVSETFRTASLAASATQTDYLRDIGRIQAAIADTVGVTDRQGSVAQQQLDGMRAQVSSLIDINESVRSVEEAIADLQSEIAKLRASSDKTADSTAAQERFLRNVSDGGTSLKVSVQ